MIDWNTGKHDRWWSLGVLEVEFKAVKKGRARTSTSAVRQWHIPNHVRVDALSAVETLPLLYLGTPASKALI
jgi:hypothetical protein